MSVQDSDATMAVFLDLENIALGAEFPAFDIRKVLERLLLKGQIVVKKTYCDFERYKTFKRGLHEAAFELIEIPHVRQSGKNSADIRMVVDALDLCYTKAHVDTFVILSGDSDFSPLVSKLRENNKVVIGVGVKKSTSDLLTANCDDFLFYDDLGSCTSPLRIIPSAQKPGKMPHLTTLWRGQCHGLASFLLPTCFVGDHLALRHFACHWVQARPARPTRAGQAQAQAFYRAQ